jgi:hypothetical protein
MEHSGTICGTFRNHPWNIQAPSIGHGKFFHLSSVCSRVHRLGRCGVRHWRYVPLVHYIRRGGRRKGLHVRGDRVVAPVRVISGLVVQEDMIAARIWPAVQGGVGARRTRGLDQVPTVGVLHHSKDPGARKKTKTKTTVRVRVESVLRAVAVL